jgi:hypothetical protein
VSLSKSLNSKVIYKIWFLVAIIIIFIVSRVAILAYFQSQQTLLGNSINIAGKNRFLTANLLYQISQYLIGVVLSSSSSSFRSHDYISNINDAINKLDTNILVLREGGKADGIDLKPLSSEFLGSWKIINNDWISYKTFITDRIVKPEKSIIPLLQQQQPQQRNTTSNFTITTSAAKIYQSTKTELESMAAGLINSSDNLVRQLGDHAAKNSFNLMLLDILFGIMNISIVVIIILYLVIKVLKPLMKNSSTKID